MTAPTREDVELDLPGAALLATGVFGMLFPAVQYDAARDARLALLMVPGIGWLLAVPLLLAGLGGGSVITPNQALSPAEVDVGGGSTAGGTLQTSQRVGNAIGAALITAVFYAVARGAPPAGPAREAHYGRAYTLALVVSVAFAVAAWLVAARSARGLAGAVPPPDGCEADRPARSLPSGEEAHDDD